MLWHIFALKNEKSWFARIISKISKVDLNKDTEETITRW